MLADNGRSSALVGNSRYNFLGEEGAHVEIKYNVGSSFVVAHVKEFFGGC